MRDDEHRLSSGNAAGKSRDNVLNASRLLIARADRGRVLDLRAESDGGELADDVIAHAIVIRGAHRMRPPRDLRDVPHRTLGRERRIGSRRRNGSRRTGNAKNRGRAKDQEANGNVCALEFHPSPEQHTPNRRTTMRRTLFVVSFALLGAGSVQAQALPYRVVFDLTSRDTLEQRAVLRWIKEVGTASPNAQMEVVMYAKGIELVMPERSAY